MNRTTQALLGIGLAAFTAAPARATPPVNDAFAARAPLTGWRAVAAVDTREATGETDEPDHAGQPAARSVWWQWHSTRSGWLTLSTAGSARANGSPLDTRLGLYSGGPLTSLRPIASNDDEADLGGTSRVRTRVGASVVYFLAADSSPEGGDLKLTLDFEPFAEQPAWELPAVGGGVLRQDTFTGQVVVLSFWATWCSQCKKQIPDFIALRELMGPSGLRVLGVATDNAIDDAPPSGLVASTMAQYGINYPVAMSRPDGSMEASFGGISVWPTTWIIDRSNRVVEEIVGVVDRPTLAKKIAPLLGGFRATRAASGQIRLSWPSHGMQLNERVETAETPAGPWTLLGNATGQEAGEWLRLATPGNAQRYYRLRY